MKKRICTVGAIFLTAVFLIMAAGTGGEAREQAPAVHQNTEQAAPGNGEDAQGQVSLEGMENGNRGAIEGQEASPDTSEPGPEASGNADDINTDINTGINKGTDSDSDTGTDKDTVPDTDPGKDTDADTVSVPEADTETDKETETDTDADTDTDTDTDTGTDADAGADTGNDADAGADADAVSEADSAADSGGEYRETEFQDPRVPVIDTSVKIMPGIRIAVVSKKVNGSFWTTLRKGMEAAVKDINKAYGFERSQRITMTFEGARDEQDVTKQINTLDAVLSENPGVLCLCASDVSSCQAQLEEARDNGIPVVTFDSTVADEDLVNAYRGTDNQKLGEIAAGKLAEAVGKKGKIAVFSEQQKTYSIQKRVEGFLSRMEDYPDITVLDVIYVDQVEDMAEEMNALRQGNPDLSGVYCTNADISDLYLDVIGKEETETVFVGTDGTEKQQKAVRDGKELGTVSQDPFAMGYETILTAAAFTQPPTGTFPEKISLMEPCWICQENLDDPANVGFLY